MVDHRKIQDKWQRKWKKEKVFDVNVDKKKKKFFINIPYPYISGSLHIGHGRVVTETDVYARYLRMNGLNVLYPIAFHISGTPVLGISLAIKNGDKKKIELYKNYVRPYVNNENEVVKVVQSFEDPWKIVDFFIPKMINEFSTLGLGVDWRRTFNSGDVAHQKMVEWQFKKFKDKKYLVRGKYPVLFSKSLDNAVGEDDIADGDTNPVEKQEFTLIKFKFGDSYIMAGTLRPETMFGQTNMWVNPNVVYVKAKVDNEKWIVSKECLEKLEYQDKKVEVIEEIKGKDLLGKKCFAPFVEREIIILPSEHCDPSIVTGLVTSVPSDAPFDYVALKELKNSKEMCKKYKLNHDEIKKIKLIPIIKSKGYSDYAAVDAVDKFKIKSLKDSEKLEQATQDVYKAGHHTGVLVETCGKFEGMKVEEAKEAMKKELLKKKKADIFYETSRKAVSRDGGEIIVAILDGQWFLDFNAKGWKKDANKCLAAMKIEPDKFRKQFEDVFDWLDKRPCARKRGLGTKLPFDKEWVIESLSDSTIYMSLYAIKDKLEEFKISSEKLKPEFFDYVYNGEGDLNKLSQELKIDKKQLQEIKESFDYWYPNDHRHTFSSHIPNHLSFMIFAHVACFKKKNWPKKISLHGMVMSEGSKMSKSKGNVVTLLELNEKYGADAFRAFLCNNTSVEGTMNWQSSEVERMKKHLEQLFEVLKKMSKERKKGVVKNKALVSRIEKLIIKASLSLEDMNLRTYSNVVLYDLLRVYNKVKEDKEIVNEYLFQKWVKMLCPLVPHIAEELWDGKDEFVSISKWPNYDKKKIDDTAEFIEDSVENLLSDVQEIKKLAKVENLKKVKIIISPKWKYKFFKDFKKKYEKEKNVGALIKSLITKEYGKEISKLVPMLVKHPSKIPRIVLSQKEEYDIYVEKKDFLERDLKCVVEIELAEKSKEGKAKNAIPSKAAILVE